MTKIRTDFGNLTVDADSITYYSVSADLQKKSYEITFYFSETSNSLTSKLSSVEELVKLMKAIDFERSSLQIIKNKG